MDHILEFANAEADEAKEILRSMLRVKPTRFPEPKAVGTAQKRLSDVLDTVVRARSRPGIDGRLFTKLLPEGMPTEELELLDVDEQIVIHLDPRCDSFREWYGVHLALFAEDGLADRMIRCADSACGNYFVDWPGKRGRPRRRYCSTRHANRDRQRQFRSWRKEQ